MRRRLPTACVGLISLFFIFHSTMTSDPPRRDAEFVYARIRYHMTPEAFMVREAPWHHDYPYGDSMFPTVVGEVSNIRTNSMAYEIVDIDSPDLFQYPFTYLSEPGYLELNAKDVANLREYLDRGGFVLVDDFRTADFSPQARGMAVDDIANFRRQMKKVYPERDFVRLDVSDPIFSAFYKIKSLDMIPAYVFAGQRPVEFLALRDPRGNIQMVLNNNNDLSEFWEWLNEGAKSLHDASTSLEFGVNYLVYAMTH